MPSLSSGIPLRADLQALLADDEYQRHVKFNQQFLTRHGPALRKYGRKWGTDPLSLWSRRWEYPYVARRIIDFAQGRPEPSRGELRILDAGSGVTYFPYYLCDSIPGARATCVDYDTTYNTMFADINAGETNPCVNFQQASLQKLPLDSRSIDAVCCISVLEHTSEYPQILDEFSRVLRSGGLLVLTFDLSLDGKFELSRPDAEKLLGEVVKRFNTSSTPADLSRMDQPDQILTTTWVRDTEPHLLPWRHPWLKGIKDLLEGHGWTGGFRSKSVFCLEARAR